MTVKVFWSEFSQTKVTTLHLKNQLFHAIQKSMYAFSSLRFTFVEFTEPNVYVSNDRIQT